MEEKINIIYENDGKVTFSNEVLTAITRAAILEVRGTAKNKNAYHSIRISAQKNAVTVDASVTLVYGSNLREICVEIQNNIAKNLELMTGLSISAVNIVAACVTLDSEETTA